MSQAPADYLPRRYELRHRTTYTYEGTVDACYERGFLTLRNTPTQMVVSHHVRVDPAPDLLSEHRDHFGNQSTFVEVRTEHARLEVTKSCIVDVNWPAPDLDWINGWTVANGAAGTGGDPIERAEFRLPSPLVPLEPVAAAFGADLLAPGTPLGTAILGLTTAIYSGFQYAPGSTTVRTTLAELFEARAGVCQDFAHVAVAALRSVGLPARYVSGYLETSPPPGQPKLEGSDASHAWASVMLPDGSWLDFDPTNNQLCDSRYIVTAWGRDFSDVSPLKGVVFTEAPTSSLSVAVDVTRIPS